MKLFVEDTIRYPLDLVFNTYRDNLDKLAVYLPNIDAIEVKEREEPKPDQVRLLNLWKAAPSEIPAVVRPFVDPSKLQWKDYALWDASDYSCTWRNELNIFTDQITIQGRNTFTAVGDNATKITINGDLTVDAKRIPGVPRFMAGKIGSAVEKFVVTTIKPNLTGVNRGLEKFIAAQQG